VHPIRRARDDLEFPESPTTIEELMENTKAKELLDAERQRLEGLLAQMAQVGSDDRTAADQDGDMFDSAEPLTREGTDDAIRADLEERLAAVGRAEQRLADGTYGLSVRSGQPIPDERLEADPAAELTVDEAQQGA
jgi:DnaK suppressor protein